jgi:sulfite reductase alpha subunit-like flavoprotein
MKIRICGLRPPFSNVLLGCGQLRQEVFRLGLHHVPVLLQHGAESLADVRWHLLRGSRHEYSSALPNRDVSLIGNSLASAQGSDLYFDYCVRERKNYVEVLQEFRSCRPPLSVLLEVLPVIGPRKYSIASSPALHPRTVR